MAERRRHRKRTQEVGEPFKEEKAVAKYLRFNCPTKSTNMMGHRVDYFIASKAVDCLLDSKWAKAKKGEEALFTTRESVVEYCNRLLKKQFFHRALKVMKMKPDKDTKKEKEKGKAESGKEEEKKSKKESGKDEKNKKEKEKKKDGEKEECKKDETPGTPKKKETKRKFKLEPHEDQVFLDGNEVYVWIYDPVHFKTFAMGLVLVIAVIAATLFPLWPAEMRVGVYYLSVGAGCFVASILLLAVGKCQPSSFYQQVKSNVWLFIRPLLHQVFQSNFLLTSVDLTSRVQGNLTVGINSTGQQRNTFKMQLHYWQEMDVPVRPPVGS